MVMVMRWRRSNNSAWFGFIMGHTDSFEMGELHFHLTWGGVAHIRLRRSCLIWVGGEIGAETFGSRSWVVLVVGVVKGWVK